MIDTKALAKDMVDLIEKVENEHNLEKGTLMQAWVDEYNSRIKPKKQQDYGELH